jgi:signal transduction histidine kinase
MYIPNEEWFRLHLTVADTGIGIPDDKRDEIFGTLTQLDGSSTRRFGGLGLGLTLVFGLVRALDGMIWVENGSHSGSAFHVALPMSAYSGEDGAGSDT